MKTRSLLTHLTHRFPKRLSTFHGDRLGLHVGPLPEEITSIVIGLDVNHHLIDQAVHHQAQLIITHHPFFYPSKKVALKDPQIAQLYERLVAKRIAVYCFHSNFDAAPGGMNDVLAKQAELIHIQKASNELTSYVGDLPVEMTIQEASLYIKERLQVPFMQLYEAENTQTTIRKIAICAGSGVYEWPALKELGVDLFVSGDSRYYNRVAMQRGGMNFLELHHEVETIFSNIMSNVITRYDNTIKVIPCQGTPFPKLIR